MQSYIASLEVTKAVLVKPNAELAKFQQMHLKLQYYCSGSKTRLTGFLLPPTAQIAGLINGSEASDFQSFYLCDWSHMLSVPLHGPLPSCLFAARFIQLQQTTVISERQCVADTLWSVSQDTRQESAEGNSFSVIN